jgi:hypothetical protein
MNIVKSSLAISYVDIESKTNVSETSWDNGCRVSLQNVGFWFSIGVADHSKDIITNE